MKHFIDIKDIAASELRQILNEAKRAKAARLNKPKGFIDDGAPLKDNILALIFEKSSTRTRVSFDVGMRQLGGSALILDASSSQLGRGETIADTANVLSRMVDAIMLRANSHQSVIELAKYASVPVINGLTDRSHPCQIMADLQTLEEAGLTLKGSKISWIGDGNNVLVSFIEAAEKFEFELIAACPNGYMPNEEVVQKAINNGAKITLTNDPKLAANSSDCIVTDTWVSMGDTNIEERMRDLGPYQVNQEIMELAHKNAIFLHCLPAHRGEEVTEEVIDGPQSYIFDEAENRIHAQKAILRWCFNK